MYLFGASGHAKVIIDILKSQNIRIDALVDDNKNINELEGYPVLHGVIDKTPMIISVGVNATRKRIVERLDCEFGTAIHRSAIISPTARIECGTVVMQGTIIQADVKIGEHCIINTAASIDHECVLENFVHVSPHSTLCGNVYIGEGTWIGAGSVIIPGVKIGKWAVVGAGSVVVNDIPDHVVAFGNPCKIIKKSKIL